MGPRFLLALYVILGPLVWVLYLVAVLLGRFRMSRLKRPAVPLPDPAPKVAILVPAKDEGDRTHTCMDAVLGQDYPNFFVIAIDDRSTDQTGRILDERSAKDPRLHVLHIPPGPVQAGWLGKCAALHAGVQHTLAHPATADAEWFLFVDSDVDLTPDALSVTLGFTLQRHYDAVSLLTRQECYSFFETLLVPLAGAAVMMMYLVSLTNDDNHKRNAFANGQFFLIRKEPYLAAGTHAAVRDQFTEDVELMRLMKSRGYITRLFLGQGFASTRMYSSLSKVCRGWARIFAGCSQARPWRILWGIAFLLIACLSAYPALLIGLLAPSVPFLIVAIVHLVLMSVILALLYHWSGNPAHYALYFPAAIVFLLAIYLLALRWCIAGQIEWRGTRYTIRPGPSHSAG